MDKFTDLEPGWQGPVLVMSLSEKVFEATLRLDQKYLCSKMV